MIGVDGSRLVDTNQQVHVTMYDPVSAAPNCPTDYWWISTGETRIRGVQKVKAAASKEEDFLNLLPSEILPAANNNLKLEYAFYSLGKRVRALLTNK